MKAAYSAKEISEALGISARAVRLRAQEEGWPSCEEQCRGGKTKKYGPAGFLPKDVQAKMSEHLLATTLQGVDGPSVPSNGNGCLSSSNACLSIPDPDLTNTNKHIAIPEKSDKKGLAKYQLARAWKQVVDTQPWSKRGEASEAFLLAYRSGRMLPGVHAVLGAVSLKSLYKYEKQLRDEGGDYRAIADGRGGWRKHGTNLWKPRAISDDAKTALLNCWLRPERPTVSLAIRAARMVLERSGIVEGAEDSTWRRWLRDYEKRHRDVVVMAREGEKAYRDQVGPYIARDISQLKVGQVLIADGHDLNFEILHPATGKPARLKLVMFFDWASRMPVGWQIMPTENTTVISAALRNAILNLGKIPEIVYLDNGKAFKSRFFTETDPDLTELTGLYGRLGIATCFAAPYNANARAKIIERFFLTMQEQFERLVPSYCGSSISDKPAWRARNEKFHRSMHEQRTGGYVPNIREAAYVLSLYIDWYGRQPHAGLSGKHPVDVLDAGRGQGVNAAELDFEFLWSKKVTPRRCRVTLYGIDYESDCLHGWGDEVVAKYDTADLGKIFLYAPGGAYLGEALPVAALSPVAKMLGDQVGVDQVQGEIKRQRRLAKETKKNLIELGADPEKVESLDALPWNQRAPVAQTELPLPSAAADETNKEPKLGDGERARLELVVSRAADEIEARAAKAPEIERPEYFRSEHARYEWAWRAVNEHKAQVSNEDLAFMAYFEATDEFAENYAGRYQLLAQLYS
jgi:putative transposase